MLFNTESYVYIKYGISTNSDLNPCLSLITTRPLGSAEADDVLQRCERILAALDQQDEELFQEWTEGLEGICQKHLRDPLLTLDTDMFQVNFSPAVGLVWSLVVFKCVLHSFIKRSIKNNSGRQIA